MFNLRCDFLLELDAIWSCHSRDGRERRVVVEHLEWEQNIVQVVRVSDHASCLLLNI